MDLLSVIQHEIGHALGFTHVAAPDAMASTLTAGTRVSLVETAGVDPAAPVQAQTRSLPLQFPDAPSAATAAANPVIDWSAKVVDPADTRKATAGAVGGKPAWVGSFVNHAQRSGAQASPNLGLKIELGAGGRLTPHVSSR